MATKPVTITKPVWIKPPGIFGIFGILGILGPEEEDERFEYRL